MPDLHVFIAGVSDYVNLPDAGYLLPPPATAFGLSKLESPTLSAFRFYQWIKSKTEDGKKELPYNVKLIRLLLSPSEKELAADPALKIAQEAGNVFQRCSLANFMAAAAEWRESAAVNRDDMAWFYFAGHGIQRTGDDVAMLLDEFGQGFGGALFNAVDLQTLLDGMAPSPTYPDIARRQLYFVDACRMLPDEFKQIVQQDTTQVFQVELTSPETPDDRTTPTFLSAISGAVALGFAGRPSFFSLQLIDCLNGKGAKLVQDDAGAVSYAITTEGIRDALKDSYDRWRAMGVNQNFTPRGVMHEELTLLHLSDRPNVEVEIRIDPGEALPFALLAVTDMATQTQLPVPRFIVNPTVLIWPAGYYRIEFQAHPDSNYRSPAFSFRPIEPPRRLILGKMQ